jgi:hypothetical protein
MEITDYQNLVGYWWYAADTNGHLAAFNNAGSVRFLPSSGRTKTDTKRSLVPGSITKSTSQDEEEPMSA